MMKKVAMIAAAAAMVLPLGLGVIAPVSATGVTAFAAAKKSTKVTYTLNSSKSMKKTAYHVKSGKPAYYSAAFAADKSKVTMSKKGILPTGKTYYATKKINFKMKATKTHKAMNVTRAYVKTSNGKIKGWVTLSKLTKGAYKAADGKKAKRYTVANVKSLKKSAYHFKSTSPAYYSGKFAADKAKVTLSKKGVLPARKTYYATKSMTVKDNKKNVKYLYVSSKGWVLASKLTAGKFMAAN